MNYAVLLLQWAFHHQEPAAGHNNKDDGLAFVLSHPRHTKRV